MPRRQWINCVAQAVALRLLSEVLSDTLVDGAFVDLLSPEDLALFQPNSSSWNTTTTTSDVNNPPPKHSYWFKHIPIFLIRITLREAVRYHWNIWLERAFPTRPPRRKASKSDKIRIGVKIPENNQLEGKQQRSGLSWFNTFAKWVLDLTIGRFIAAIVYVFVDAVLYAVVERYVPKGTEGKWTLIAVATLTFTDWFTLAPLATLVGFIIVPARQRIVFEAGANAVFFAFMSCVALVVVPFFVSTEFFKGVIEFMRNATLEAAGNTTLAENVNLLADEL